MEAGSKEEYYTYKRCRSVAIVIREGKILMERVFYFGREFFTLPGGGIEKGETPEQACLRELKEECGLDGQIVRPLATIHKEEGAAEYSYLVEVRDDQEAITGYDPEEDPEDPPLKEVLWMKLNEISEKDRAFLWSYGLIQVPGFFDEIKAWGDEISYPTKGLSHKEYVEKQYQKSDNLSTRISIHDKYSVNKLGLNNWYFTFYEIKKGMKILELGCGTGTLWMNHKEELAKCEQVVLSDFSEGMIETANKNLGDLANVQYKTIDIQDIPFEDDTFDIVIANYMLYHVPDINKGLEEVKRVLKPGGYFYAGTTSEVSIMDHVAKYLDMNLHYDVSFSLENGGKQLEPFFATVERKIYDDALDVTNIDDLVDYIFTGDIFKSACPYTRDEVKEKLVKHMVNGCLHIPKQPGAFVCKK